MAGGNEHFDYFIDFLFNSVEVKTLNLITVIKRTKIPHLQPVIYREEFHIGYSSQRGSVVNSS